MWDLQIVILTLTETTVIPLLTWDLWKNDFTVNKKLNMCERLIEKENDVCFYVRLANNTHAKWLTNQIPTLLMESIGLCLQ